MPNDPFGEAMYREADFDVVESLGAMAQAKAASGARSQLSHRWREE